MAQVAGHHPALDDDAPSLDPAAIERAYLRERARRRVRSDRRSAARTSHARFWFALSVLLLITVLFVLVAWQVVENTFGV